MKARENPFRVERVESVLEFDPGWLGLDWDDLFARLDRLEGRGAVVGPHGSGKSTLLRALKPRLEARGFKVIEVFLNDRHRFGEAECERLRSRVVRTDGRGFVLLDGCERLGWLAWERFRRLTRDAAGVVVTLHRKGRLPVLLETRIDALMLEAFVKRLDPAVAIDGDVMLKRHGGNAREVLRACYDARTSRP